MRKTLISLLLASTLLPLSAFAQDFYVAPRLGYGTLKGTFKFDEADVSSIKIGSQSKGRAILSLAVGYDFKRQFFLPIRAELEYAYLGNSSKTRDFSGSGRVDDIPLSIAGNAKTTLGASTFFANTYFDFHNSSAFTPYVGVGLGMSFLSAKAEGSATIAGGGITVPDEPFKYGKKTSSNFAWNLGAGAAWKVTNSVVLDLGYRYADLGKARTRYDEDDTRVKTDNVKSHQFLLGARFSF